MLKEYLKCLKINGNFSWHDISVASGLPEVTIRKIFSGETADPRFDTVAKLVRAMGGSLDKVNAIEKVEIIEKSEESQVNTLVTLKEIYEERINDIKASSAEHIQSLKRDKKILSIVIFLLSLSLIGALLIDLLMGNIGWFRY